MRFLDLSPNYSDILYILLRRHLFVNLGAIQLQIAHTSTIPAPQVLGSRNGGHEQPRDMLDSGRILVVPGAEYMLAVPSRAAALL